MRGSLTPTFVPARPVRLAVKLACRVCTTRPGFHSGLANLCTPPLHFWRQPPQLNCPPDSVLHLDFYVGVSKISSFRRVVFHIAPPHRRVPPILDNQNKVLSAKLQ